MIREGVAWLLLLINMVYYSRFTERDMAGFTLLDEISLVLFLSHRSSHLNIVPHGTQIACLKPQYMPRC